MNRIVSLKYLRTTSVTTAIVCIRNLNTSETASPCSRHNPCSPTAPLVVIAPLDRSRDHALRSHRHSTSSLGVSYHYHPAP